MLQYWKDKKGAVKRKSSLIAAARRRTGGGIEDLPELSEIELKIQNIMGGESFGSGDQNLEINPFEVCNFQGSIDLYKFIDIIEIKLIIINTFTFLGRAIG